MRFIFTVFLIVNPVDILLLVFCGVVGCSKIGAYAYKQWNGVQVQVNFKGEGIICDRHNVKVSEVYVNEKKTAVENSTCFKLYEGEEYSFLTFRCLIPWGDSFKKDVQGLIKLKIVFGEKELVFGHEEFIIAIGLKEGVETCKTWKDILLEDQTLSLKSGDGASYRCNKYMIKAFVESAGGYYVEDRNFQVFYVNNIPYFFEGNLKKDDNRIFIIVWYNGRIERLIDY